MNRKSLGAPSPAFPAASATDCLQARRQGFFRSGLRASLAPAGTARGRLGDPDLRTHLLLSSFGALLVAIAPFPAFAQSSTQGQEHAVSVRDRPHSDYDPLGLRFGGFKVNGTLDLAATSTDNLFAASDSAKVDDIIYSETPTVRVASDWSRHALTIEAGATLTQHRDFSGEDSDSHYLRASGRVDVSHATSINGAVRVAHQVTPRTDPDSPLVGAPVEYDRVDTSLGIDHQFTRLKVGVSGAESTYRYDGSQRFRNNDENMLRGRLDFEVSPRLGLMVQASADNRDYGNTPGLTSDARTFLAGVTLNTDLLRGELAVGHFERDFKDPSVGTLDGVAVAGNLEWYLTELTTFTFNARRDSDSQISSTAGVPFISTEYGARVDHELLRNLILSGEYQWGQREYASIDRTDDFNQLELGADYLVNRRVALRLRYDHYEDNSSGTMAYHDYTANAATVGISLRL
jgi:hypothetical protein